MELDDRSDLSESTHLPSGKRPRSAEPPSPNRKRFIAALPSPSPCCSAFGPDWEKQTGQLTFDNLSLSDGSSHDGQQMMVDSHAPLPVFMPTPFTPTASSSSHHYGQDASSSLSELEPLHNALCLDLYSSSSGEPPAPTAPSPPAATQIELSQYPSPALTRASSPLATSLSSLDSSWSSVCSQTTPRRPRITMGPRGDCEKCRMKVKGHWMHF